MTAYCGPTSDFDHGTWLSVPEDQIRLLFQNFWY
jgi:hypothetical protein